MRAIFTMLCTSFAGMLWSQNLLQNGKFAQEQNGWTTLRSQETIRAIERSQSYRDYGLSDQFAGLSFVELDAFSAIQQSIATEKGQSYLVAYLYSHRPAAGDKQLIVLANGKPIHTEKIANQSESGRFRSHRLSFTADSDQTVLAFYIVSLSGAEEQGILLTDIYAGKEGEVDLNLYYSY